VLAQALGVEEEDVKPSATLQGDLGAESIDFLDIVFRLEREFGIKIPRGELFSEQVFQTAAELVRDGNVTDQGLAELRTQMPYADLSFLERDRRLNRIDDLFTVDLLVSYIRWKGVEDREFHSAFAGSTPRHSPHDLAPAGVTGGT
jgi:acyl carrier protein